MKKISLIFISLFWILLLNAKDSENSILSNINYYNRDSEIEFGIDYHTTLSQDLYFHFLRNETISKNEKYNRENRWNKNIWKLSTTNQYFRSLSIGYENSSDNGSLSNLDYKVVKRMKSIESEIGFIKTDKISFLNTLKYLHHRENDQNKNNVFLLSNGFQSISDLNYENNSDKHKIQTSVALDKKILDYDWHQYFTTNAKFLYFTQKINWNTELIIEDSREEIYVYQSKDDDFKKNSYSFDTEFSRTGKTSFYVTDSYSYKKNHFDKNYLKNYTDHTNKLFSKIRFPFSFVKVELAAGFDYQKKDYKLEIQSRERTKKEIHYELKYEYSQNDTIGFRYSTDLEQYFFSHKENLYDQDIFNESNQIFIRHRFANPVILYSYFTYSTREEIYLDASLSAANRRKTKYIFQPELEMRWDDIVFSQEYALQAIYNQYIFDNVGTDQLFRKFNAFYELSYPIFNSKIIHISGLTSYKFESSDYGDFIDDIYYRNKIDDLHTFETEIKLYDKRLSLRLRPRFYYSDSIEYSPISEIIYENTNQRVKLLLNPTGTKYSDLIWKISGNIEILF